MKVLFLTKEGEIIPYVKEEHSSRVYKFVFWQKTHVTYGHGGGPLLFVGETRGERRSENPDHYELAKQAFSNSRVGQFKPDGVGRCSVITGKILEWSSVGFNVSTPMELRTSIIEALGIEEDKEGL